MELSGAGQGAAPSPARAQPGASARRSRELCGGGAAGVGAAAGVHERREGGAESGGCPVRPLLESPGGGERRARCVCAFFLILEKNAGPEARYPESIASVGRISIETKPD